MTFHLHGLLELLEFLPASEIELNDSNGAVTQAKMVTNVTKMSSCSLPVTGLMKWKWNTGVNVFGFYNMIWSDLKQGAIHQLQFPPFSCTNVNDDHICEKPPDVQKKPQNESWELKKPWSVSAVRIKKKKCQTESGEDGHVFVQLLWGSQWDRKGESGEGRKGAAGSLLHHLTPCLSCWACFRLGGETELPPSLSFNWLHTAITLSRHLKRSHQFLLRT